MVGLLFRLEIADAGVRRRLDRRHAHAGRSPRACQYADRVLKAEDLLQDPGLRFVPMFIGVQHGGNS